MNVCWTKKPFRFEPNNNTEWRLINSFQMIILILSLPSVEECLNTFNDSFISNEEIIPSKWIRTLFLVTQKLNTKLKSAMINPTLNILHGIWIVIQWEIKLKKKSYFTLFCVIFCRVAKLRMLSNLWHVLWGKFCVVQKRQSGWWSSFSRSAIHVGMHNGFGG